MYGYKVYCNIDTMYQCMGTRYTVLSIYQCSHTQYTRNQTHFIHVVTYLFIDVWVQVILYHRCFALYGYKVYCTINTPVFTHSTLGIRVCLLRCNQHTVKSWLELLQNVESCVRGLQDVVSRQSQGILYYQYTSLHTHSTLGIRVCLYHRYDVSM